MKILYRLIALSSILLIFNTYTVKKTEFPKIKNRCKVTLAYIDTCFKTIEQSNPTWKDYHPAAVEAITTFCQDLKNNIRPEESQNKCLNNLFRKINDIEYRRKISEEDPATLITLPEDYSGLKKPKKVTFDHQENDTSQPVPPKSPGTSRKKHTPENILNEEDSSVPPKSPRLGRKKDKDETVLPQSTTTKLHHSSHTKRHKKGSSSSFSRPLILGTFGVTGIMGIAILYRVLATPYFEKKEQEATNEKAKKLYKILRCTPLTQMTSTVCTAIKNTLPSTSA